jgi:hypothetical protein
MKQIEITDGSTTLKLTIAPANIIAAFLRSGLQEKAKTETDPLRGWAYHWLYSSCLACSNGTITREGVDAPILELPFDDYFAMSDELTVPWINAVYEVNPHWAPPAPLTVEEKKKETTKAQQLSYGSVTSAQKRKKTPRHQASQKTSTSTIH